MPGVAESFGENACLGPGVAVTDSSVNSPVCGTTTPLFAIKL